MEYYVYPFLDRKTNTLPDGNICDVVEAEVHGLVQTDLQSKHFPRVASDIRHWRTFVQNIIFLPLPLFPELYFYPQVQ